MAIVAGLFVIAIGLRALNVWRPVDGSIWNGSREANTAAMARNFDREGMNLLGPRIDWRGNGPGLVECGLPLPSFLGALLYRVFGYHEEFLRLISLAAAVLGCYVFWRLADRVLPRWPAAIAFGFFASQPLLVASASWIQSESLMLLCYMAAVDQFDRWTDSRRWRHFASTWLASTLAILVFLPSVHLWLLFALMAFRKLGRGAVRRVDLWALFAATALPPLVWYTHAHALWRDFGNSLGVYCGMSDLFSSLGSFSSIAVAAAGVFVAEAAFVWTPTGLLVALPSAQGVMRSRAAIVVEWALALAAYYLATMVATGANWGIYYHVVSAPVVALAVGVASQFLFEAIDARPWDLRVSRGLMRQMWLSMAAIAAAYAVLGGAVHYLVGQSTSALAIASAIGLSGSLVLFYLGHWARGRSPRARTRRFRVWLVGLLTAGSLTAGWNVVEIRRYFQGRPEVFAKYEAALQFKPRMRDSGPIAIAADERRDAAGGNVPNNVPYYFYWLDRKGFVVPAGDLSIERLRDLVGRGVRFFIAERDAWNRVPALEGIVRRRYRVLEDHPTATLFDLVPSAERAIESTTDD